MPPSPFSKRRMRLMFDNTGGYATGCALMNMELSPAVVSAFFYDPDGASTGIGAINLSATGQLAFDIATQFSELRGRRGMIEFTTSGQYLAGLGLLFNPGGAFTSVSPLSRDTW